MTTAELTTEVKEVSIVKIDPREYGLEESKAADIAAQFKPMLDRMVELEKEYNEIIQLPIEDVATSRKAKELRLKYVKVRTGTAEIHKAQKAFYLAGGRFVDGWKNAQLFASQGIEEKLEAIEKHQENLEKERIEKLRAEREAALAPYGVENIEMLSLGHMADQVWENFLSGTKANHQAKLDAELLAEAEKIEKEKAEADERERVRIENAKLKAEAEAREKVIAEERAKAEKERLAVEAARKKEQAAAEAKLKAEREVAEKKIREEREKAEAAAAKAKAEQDAKIKAEREAREKAEAELKAKQEAEARAAREKEEAEQAELAKGDRAKFVSLISDLESLKSKYAFTSKKHKALYNSVCELIDKTITFSKSKL